MPHLEPVVSGSGVWSGAGGGIHTCRRRCGYKSWSRRVGSNHRPADYESPHEVSTCVQIHPLLRDYTSAVSILSDGIHRTPACSVSVSVSTLECWPGSGVCPSTWVHSKVRGIDSCRSLRATFAIYGLLENTAFDAAAAGPVRCLSFALDAGPLMSRSTNRWSSITEPEIWFPAP